MNKLTLPLGRIRIRRNVLSAGGPCAIVGKGATEVIDLGVNGRPERTYGNSDVYAVPDVTQEALLGQSFLGQGVFGPMQDSNGCREWGIFIKHRAIDRLSGRPYSRGRGKRFQIPIPLKTAKALGIKIPDIVMLRADKVIE